MYNNPAIAFAYGTYCLVPVSLPVKSREFPAKNERLVTAADMVRFGV
ncbi:hypothetical protein MAUB1S_03579 [Mycolicibacterium aubagnense]